MISKLISPIGQMNKKNFLTILKSFKKVLIVNKK